MCNSSHLALLPSPLSIPLLLLPFPLSLSLCSLLHWHNPSTLAAWLVSLFCYAFAHLLPHFFVVSSFYFFATYFPLMRCGFAVKYASTERHIHTHTLTQGEGLGARIWLDSRLALRPSTFMLIKFMLI